MVYQDIQSCQRRRLPNTCEEVSLSIICYLYIYIYIYSNCHYCMRNYHGQLIDIRQTTLATFSEAAE